MLLADANTGNISEWPGIDEDFSTNPVSGSSATMSPTMTPTPTTEATVSLPEVDTDVQNVQGGFSWWLFLIIVIAIIGAVITLYLRNRK